MDYNYYASCRVFKHYEIEVLAHDAVHCYRFEAFSWNNFSRFSVEEHRDYL
jgi:hypothetical protein